MTMNNKPFQDWLLTTLANLNYENNNNKFTTNLNNPVNNNKNYHETQSIDISKNSELLFSSNGDWKRRDGSFLPENRQEFIERQRQSFINFLTKLSEERQLYMNVINQVEKNINILNYILFFLIVISKIIYTWLFCFLDPRIIFKGQTSFAS